MDIDIKIKRLFGMAIDFFIIVFLSTILVAIVNLGTLDTTPFSISVYFCSYAVFILIKDFLFKNASIGKRIFKIKIIKTNGANLTFSDMIKRNIPLVLFLWPLETFILILNGRRIGDMWAKTDIVYSNMN